MENSKIECGCTENVPCDFHSEESRKWREMTPEERHEAYRAKRAEELALFQLVMPVKDEQVKRVGSAWDATVGAGNVSETVEFEVLEERLGRKPTEDERQTFKEAWRECLQEMAQP